MGNLFGQPAISRDLLRSRHSCVFDQVLTLDANQDGGRRRSALTLLDDPEYSIAELLAVTDRIKDVSEEAKRNEIAKFTASHGRPNQRLYLGRADDRSVALKLKDVEGRDRVVIEVAADGSPAIRFLDPAGKIIGEIPSSGR